MLAMSKEQNIKALEEQREQVRELVVMAKREVAAGNERMRPYLEGYASRLDSIVHEIHRLKDA